MKKSFMLLLVVGLIIGGVVFVQFFVIIYGIVDISICYLSNDNVQGSSNVCMDNGVIFNSCIGFKGIEDLGGGLKVVFCLENGFSSDIGVV